MIVEDPSVEDIARMDGFEATGLAGLRDPVTALECSCMCHTRRFGLPTANMHDEGRTCQCQRMAPLIDAERTAAFELARRHGMQISIESDVDPTIISGRYGGHQFWYHERQGDWQVHLHDFDGPLIAESGFIDLAEAVELIRDRLDRYDCSACGLDGSKAASTFCGDCGRPHSTSADDWRRSMPR